MSWERRGLPSIRLSDQHSQRHSPYRSLRLRLKNLPQRLWQSACLLLIRDALDGLFEQQRRDLHRACVRLFRELLKPLERFRRESDEALLAPRRGSGTPDALGPGRAKSCKISVPRNGYLKFGDQTGDS